ncbi:MAG TPA: NADH-quinone oxidoreductase subunit NuoE [Bacteroidales bacterium]|nr:NADH-quinone oxidoreductase subunit NuoE [Bacteroidales bacterium]
MRIERVPVAHVETKAPEVDLSLIDSILHHYQNHKGAVIPVLQKIQDVYGYLPSVAIVKAAETLHIPVSDIFGVATFYSQFRLHPVGKHIIKVCHGTACHVQNATAISDAIEEALEIKDGQTTEDGLFTLESVACLGCCSLAPVMMISGETYGKLTGKSAVKIVNDIRMQEKQK